MNSVKKFATFEEMKSFENKAIQSVLCLEKHNNFKKVILDIRSSKIQIDHQQQFKR